MTATLWQYIPASKKVKTTDKELNQDKKEISAQLKELKKELDFVHNSLNYATDPILIDSYIYEINALNMRYQYFVKVCKDFGITVSDV